MATRKILTLLCVSFFVSALPSSALGEEFVDPVFELLGARINLGKVESCTLKDVLDSAERRLSGVCEDWYNLECDPCELTTGVCEGGGLVCECTAYCIR